MKCSCGFEGATDKEVYQHIEYMIFSMGETYDEHHDTHN